MKLPDLVVVGAMKAGTTALHDQLAQHPDVFMSEVKETDHFLRPDALARMEDYARHFEGAEGHAVVGESSPNYTKREAFPGVPERMVEALGAVRVIYLVRDPIERIRSHYQHHLATRGRWMTFDEAATYEGFVAPTRYASQIRPYLELLGRERVLLMTTEHFADDPVAAMGAVWTFLGVPAHAVEVVRSHRTADKRMPRGGKVLGRLGRRLPRRLATRPVNAAEPLSASTRARLVDALRPEVEQLHSLGVVGFDGWGFLGAH